MLDVRQLACLRGDRLLFRRLDLHCAPGSLTRVAGANGMGKTSLLRLVAGLARPEAGDILWQGTPIGDGRDAWHAALLYLGHAPALNELLTPLENLRFACALGGDAADDAACTEALTRIGLARQIGLPCKLLSQGQRRRVGLARLYLGHTRPLWVLDEPFTALDAAAVTALSAHIDGHVAAGGAVLFTTHQDVPFRHAVHTLDVEAFAR
ncbi:cytochrome c biogenesis heme-transporting ATPase CcmA [Uliginosibacterium sp. H1]|uniref:cytochrome c biogenesis heme-transporting ATPase CcmA n=1 Tax=Uliginosibacterium sp. H1 TaxID=3114757 RepID=UPI002E16BC55|nr:cytochrome c biogenesis heme-transporting ATPase CcmA [Uliginosibacterium sp. H1]